MWLMIGLLVLAGPARASRFVVPQQVDGREGVEVLTTCALSNGNFVVGWSYVPVDDAAAPKDYRYRLYSPDGTPLTAELTAATSPSATPSGQIYCDAAGGFVLVWSAGPWGGGSDSFVSRFDNDGAPVSGAIPFTPPHVLPRICKLSNGGWAAVWSSPVMVDGFERGVPRVGVFDANFTPLVTGIDPSGQGDLVGGDLEIACLDSSFVVAWQNFVAPLEMRVRRFDNSGTPLGGNIVVGSHFGGNVGIVPSGSGGFLIGWAEAGPRMRLRRYDAAGNALGAAFDASAASGTQSVVSLTSGPGGAALALWLTGDPDSGGCAGSAAEARLITPDGPSPAQVPLVGASTSPSSRGGVLTAAGALNADAAMLLVHTSYEQDADSITVFGDSYPVYTTPTLGNGQINAACGEQCDDGNQLSCDGCSAGALIETGAVCGDGVTSTTCSEECDDGNAVTGDGCGQCRTEVTTSDTVPPGGTVSSGMAPSPSQPVVTGVTSPTGGAIQILETGAGAATGFQALDRLVVISAPPASVSEPLQLNFSFANSLLPPGVDETNLMIRRNGVVLPECTGAPAAIPNPCVSARSAIPGGVQVTALTSAASEWSFGVPLCDPAPRSGCRESGQSALSVSDAADDAKDKLAWAWKKGAATSVADFGDPRRSSSYALCVYDAGGLVASTSLSPGGTCDGEPCWTVRSKAKGFKGLRLEANGKASVGLSTGEAGKAAIKLKASGGTVDSTPLPFTPPVTAQVVQSDSSRCWSDTYSGDEIGKNLAPAGKTAAFKAKAKN